jgi:formamidopyrimidine-DNA glycosylase
MPELPDVSLYVTRLKERLIGDTLEKMRFFSPFVLRSVGVAQSEFVGRKVVDVFRLGKRIVLEFEDEHFVVIHLMIAGRFEWKSPPPAEPKAIGKVMLACWRFTKGQLTLVEASSRKRASVHLVSGRAALSEHKRAGIDVFTASIAEFTQRLQSKNRTLKRALTDPSAFDGIGNAYSDEILFHAGLSPVRQTSTLDEEEIERLLGSSRKTFAEWTDKLQEMYPGFPKPKDITAFRPEFCVHGRFGQPCVVCGSKIQHIVYAENETNYCARCQNEGRLLADRSLSRLLKEDWPRTLEEMEGERG